ncbi:MAG: CYTH domain-containing protein [Ruminococcaceae bacterium]|nr:CYTH domain-containing protein [Oscillospiraceae bacterium]MBQ3215961.1 CYTH domain-containing protein [Oscillospiraceae bacterium]
MGIEFEMKYSAEPAQQEAVLAAYPLEYQTFQMETTYFDTPDSALSHRHITLRRRMENDASVCTVKTPVSTYGRGEWECECEDIEQAIPKLCKLGADEALLSLTAAGVVPVCGARFTRQAGVVTFRESQLEIALDRGILSGGGQEMPLCEIEVELKSGSPEDAVAFGALLAQRFGLVPQKRSKFRRALALAKGENI